MSAPGYKASKSRITAMVCGNINVKLRLPLLIIGKFANPRCFKGIKIFPVIYKKQNNSWMVTNIFIEWYDTVFIPEVKKHQIATGKSGNVLFVQQLYKEIDLKKAVYMAAEAWATLKDITLANSWNKLLPSELSIPASEELPNRQFLSELAELITKSSVFKECDQKDIQDWLECDVDDPGYQLLTDDEIIKSVVDDQGSNDNEEEFRNDDQVEKGPSNETAMKWLSLKRLRNLAAKKQNHL
ncbi:hypothetical protein LAZ67_8000911 [Cordylochernes scorpioides]|uniref:DDE-1 domain-containing protein n=1 Tax=Cordylochernes scorpioides TaxID=51811 RepID=A0ABY6KQ96_9ARAC|nr:hypothetical protein LAZ67_8000911 [Cordylochernes scorpioides]